MFYETGKDHGLPYDPFKACVVPRPIGWISTRSPQGKDNLAPYSQFNNLTFDPPYVMFSSNRTPEGKRKDTVINAESTGVFAWNLATYPLREKVNITAQQLDYGQDEFLTADLQKEDARLIPCSLVADSPVRFECAFHQLIELPGNPPMGTVDIIIARVLAIHISDNVITDGKIDISKTQPIARLGYYDYAVIKDTFEMRIPGTNKALLDGLEGSSRANRTLGEEEGKEVGQEVLGSGEGEVKEGKEVKEQLKRAQSAGAKVALGEKN
ncbi:hypothetical protein M438DRAFT_310318 [Aureobasidium pullulans EXF-150]|uniref:Flavin reductase like domain-containing protein n=1 Tax=Aureobasidium pullulans EXF-150 TaxID=1043002 RepID=A0A074Y206_AURPU|nr:uncharacterized protein M438DRAFT_310318 [Aureobasidium pullulans EXF-150]KEQ88227.1 hypothetical protein M438DRAFT_310318 [Aureobasidium pullulans EXF-150]